MSEKELKNIVVDNCGFSYKKITKAILLNNNFIIFSVKKNIFNYDFKNKKLSIV